MTHPAYSDQIPSIIRSCPRLSNVVAKLRQAGRTYNERTTFIVEQFAALISYAAPANDELADSPNFPSEYLNDLPERPPENRANVASDQTPIRSSAWTGRSTPGEQAQLVLSLAPAALECIAEIISDENRRRHNYPPEIVDETLASLDALKRLHEELGALIGLAEAGSSLETQIEAVRSLGGRIFAWSRETASLSVAGVSPLLASAPATIGLWTTLSAMCSPSVMQSVGNPLIAAIPASFIAAALGRNSSPKQGGAADE
jgi:hypothetical protein